MGNTLVRIERVSRAWNSRLASYTILVDDRQVGAIRNGQTVDVPVSPGPHRVRVSQSAFSSNTVEVSVADGDVVRLMCEPTLSLREPMRLWPVGAAAPAGAVTGYRVTGMRETGTSEEPIGTESRTIGNPSRSTTITRTIRITREWSKSFEVGREASASGRLALSAGPEWLRAEGSVEAEIKRTYSSTATSREEFSEEVVLQIGPASSVRLGLQWKRIWQEGVAHVVGPDGEFDVPYRLVRAITFDQSVTDA